MFKIGVTLLILFFGVSIQAQVDEEEKDSIKTGVDLGHLELGNPQSITEAYTYDPASDRYIYTKTLDGFNINYPIILTPQEYEELLTRESIRDYYQKKLDAIDGKKAGSEEAKKDLLPRYYVNSGLFESIFGSNTIDIKPTGSVEMDLGIRFTKQDNPSFSPRNRKTLTFDFDQRISMSLQGKVGTRLLVNINYDTQSTFAFQNLIKLEYTPTEDDIIRKIEVGNVSFPLNSSLIRGAQSLFGVKTQLQFGKTTVTGVFSEQKSQTRSVSAQGGGTLQDFELFALDYDADRHYFLSQYFRNKYDEALATYPVISSRVQITRMEVWITNKQNRVNATDNNLRNILALQDLGEGQLTDVAGADITDSTVGVHDQNIAGFYTPPSFNLPSDNTNNRFDPALIGSATGLLDPDIRDIATANNGFSSEVAVVEGRDYAKLENARKLSPSDYTYHPQLGYISLNQRLANDEVLAVAYQYSVGNDIFQVGEFGTDGVDATEINGGIPTSQSLILKMLKSNLNNIDQPVWNLMMKNIYQIPGGYQLSQEDFRFNILYTDPSPLNYINLVPPLPNPDEVTSTPLLKVFDLDKLNYTNDPQEGGDGFFDFIPGMTVDTQNGRLIFTTVEPFGKTLFEKLRDNPSRNYEDPLTGYNDNQTKYVFKNLYDKTQALALQDSEKNKFQLKGKFKSTGGDGISIGAFNVPQGSVVVSTGGRVLIEGVDYTVDYQRGRVQILDPTLANAPIDVSLENNSVFGQQTRRFYGVNVEHKISDKFQVAGTFLRLSEKPFTQKSNYGQESVNNTIVGMNGNFSTEIPFFTRMVNKLPNLDTDVPSNFSFRGEIAYLMPDASKNDSFNGEATVYIDDFEGSQSTIDMRAPLSWSLASTPVEGDYDGSVLDDQPFDNLLLGYKRAKLSWYTIDPVFYVESQRPSGISEQDMLTNRVRRIYSDELYPNVDIAQGQSTVVSTLDMTYYPGERGPYNYSPLADPATNALANPTSNWAGIMRPINSTNFEQSNVEYVQFWMMDPYYGQNPGDTTPETNVGKLTINLGEITEDILNDGRKLYENGLPEVGSTIPTHSTNWGKIPSAQSLIYAFDSDEANRAVQDVGLNGLSDAEEAVKHSDFAANPDPSADNYQYYLNAGGDVLQRYKNYNGLEGNSPISLSDDNRGSTTLPDVEDINRDNTMNTINAYYRFEIPIQPNPVIGQNYVVDTRVNDAVSIANGTTKVRWVLYKVPILEATAANTVGSISDFRSIRFMRMFLTDFPEELTLRFGSLDLVRGEWRRYLSSMDNNDPDASDDNTGFDVTSLNIQENGDRRPIPYVMPPGVAREQLNNNNSIINQNEQSLSLRVYSKDGSPTGGLEEKDARSVFKNVSVDMRQFKKLRMFLHAESLETSSDLQNDEMVAFLRFGNDFTQNFYEVQIPLKPTAFGEKDPARVWPTANEIDLALSLLTQLKIRALQGTLPPDDDLTDGIQFVNEDFLDGSLAGKENLLRIGVSGNPNFGLVRTLMVGVRNRTNPGKTIRGEVWFNELRMSEMDNKGGWAAVAAMDTNFADFADISATTRKTTIGFGGLEEGPNERSREDVFQYNVVTNVNAGKLLPKKWGITIPFNYAVGEETITPKYDPFYQDIELEQLLDVTQDPAERANIEDRAIDYTKRTSINFIGVKKERTQDQKQHFYDPENFTFSHSYNEMNHHDFQIESMLDQQVRTSADYAFAFKPNSVEPLKNTKFMKKSSYWKLLSDFNFSYLPTTVSFSTNILRQYNRQEFRQVEVEGIGLDPLYRRNYLYNFNYGFNYSFSKALRFSYNVSTNNIVRNYFDENKIPIDDLTVWDDYFNIGEANLHTQQLIVNYDIPINKIPFLAFVKSAYSYTSDYSWTRSSDALSSVEFQGSLWSLGNTIQNAASHKLNTTLTMDLFYKYIGLTAKKNKTVKPQAKPATPKPGQKVTAAPTNVAEERSLFSERMIGLVTALKTLQVNYTQNEGTMLPGYLPRVGFIGTTKPTIGFVLGSQDDVRYDAARNGWLTYYPEFNQNFTQVDNKILNVTGQLEPFPDFKIDILADWIKSKNFSEQYDVSPDGTYNPRSPYTFGNYSMSTILIGTAFSKSDENVSSAFDDFRENRLKIANRLATERGIDINDPAKIDADGYPKGYGKNSQAVLLPAFYAAYKGTDASKIQTGPFRDLPLPNWNVKYTGLMRYNWFKEKFKRFSLQHGYRAAYTLNQFRSNFEYYENPNPDVSSGTVNYPTKDIISNVNLVEQFNPLIRMDFEMKSSIKVLAEMRKDRALSLSFDNNLLTEVKGNEYIVGLGYRVKDITFTSSLADDPSGVIKSDINMKADVSYRSNKTIVRYLDYDNNQLGGGQDIWSIKFTADYSFSRNLTAIFYYDHSFSKAVISTTFPITNIRSGFTLRYNFGN
ncbi:cell surface protein SprA [Flavobacterium enshiense]|uniref:T9SS outer membrane translocon Sov/SprA n=1 Tax=Flavobacterium enshiense TaxID=1341165 RepID=UPI001FCCB430|nr:MULTISPECIES: cell surface protein SprA [Flavobacterium]UOK43985.1 cell surface protein SprA [Flavobacterium enshiense]